MKVLKTSKIERLTKILEKLASKTASGTPIIVEGKKDVQALKRLNVLGTTITLKNTGKIIEDALDELQTSEVIVFVDFDDHGTELTKEILHHMERRGTRTNLVFWKQVRALVRRDIKDVEGLPSYLNNLKQKSI